MLYIRTVFRLLGFFLVTLTAALVGLLFKVLGAKLPLIFRVYLAWKKSILFVLNIRVSTEGEAPTEPGIIMANHRSYVDVALTPSNKPFVIVAKKSVGSWPLVGWGGKAISTIWVDRDSKDSRQETRRQMKDRLEKGGSVLVFPEGTTSVGPGILELKPGMFHTCAQGGFTIHPFAIEYENPKIAWVGDDLFLPHFVRHFGKPRIRVKVKYGPSLTNGDGDVLKEKTAEWLEKTTLEMRREWDEKA